MIWRKKQSQPDPGDPVIARYARRGVRAPRGGSGWLGGGSGWLRGWLGMRRLGMARSGYSSSGWLGMGDVGGMTDLYAEITRGRIDQRDNPDIWAQQLIIMKLAKHNREN